MKSVVIKLLYVSLLWSFSLSCDAVDFTGTWSCDIASFKKSLQAQATPEMLAELGATKEEYAEYIKMFSMSLKDMKIVVAAKGFTIGVGDERMAFTCTFVEKDGMVTAVNIAPVEEHIFEEGELAHIALTATKDVLIYKAPDVGTVHFNKIDAKEVVPEKIQE